MMYDAHFGLSALPFSITPDTNFFFGHASCQEALNTLLIAVRSGEGFIKVVGEVGTGKTLLCRKFLNALESENFVTAYIPNPYLEPMTLLLAVADEFGVKYDANINQHQLLKLLTQFLIDTHAHGKRAVLCLDEAQAMPIETLEALRLLSNLETETSKLLQVVLFGQPELDVKLADPSIRQLHQRIAFSCRLGHLGMTDVEYYLMHRLGIAGYRGPRLFSQDAVKMLHRASKGVPRLINILAHKSMLAAYGEGGRYITDKYIKLAIVDTESANRSAAGQRQWIIKIAVAIATVTLLSIGIWYWVTRA
jgi:MSHA biogenesis protein MshM